MAIHSDDLELATATELRKKPPRVDEMEDGNFTTHGRSTGRANK